MTFLMDMTKTTDTHFYAIALHVFEIGASVEAQLRADGCTINKPDAVGERTIWFPVEVETEVMSQDGTSYEDATSTFTLKGHAYVFSYEGATPSMVSFDPEGQALLDAAAAENAEEATTFEVNGDSIVTASLHVVEIAAEVEAQLRADGCSISEPEEYGERTLWFNRRIAVRYDMNISFFFVVGSYAYMIDAESQVELGVQFDPEGQAQIDTCGKMSKAGV